MSHLLLALAARASGGRKDMMSITLWRTGTNGTSTRLMSISAS